jgi:HK97 family phage prohead protease
MPYHIDENHPDCDGVAVVKDDDGKLMGCHPNKKEAQEQMEALYAAEADRAGGSAIERRFFRGELRAEGEGTEQRIIGYAAPFNSLSEDLGGWREIIEPGAFSETLEDDIRALFNHDPNLVLGRNKAGTLSLLEDDMGLRYEILPPDTQYARDLATSIKRGDVDGSSFAFRAIEESWINPTSEQPLPVRRLHVVRLFDVSPVTFPAYPVTSVAVRDMAQQLALAGRATGQAGGGVAVGRLALRRRRLELLEKL